MCWGEEQQIEEKPPCYGYVREEENSYQLLPFLLDVVGGGVELHHSGSRGKELYHTGARGKELYLTGAREKELYHTGARGNVLNHSDSGPRGEEL